MGLFNKMLNKEKTYAEMSQQEKLDYIKQLELTYESNIGKGGENYYSSEEAKILAKKISQLQDEYVESYPSDFLICGADLFQYQWCSLENVPVVDRNIFKLVGMGRCYEKFEEYEKAIEMYQQANELTITELGDEIQELIEENGPGDYLYTVKIKERISVCEYRMLKNRTVDLELKAKELENDNPEEAIEMYGELNRLRPGLKKYDKRIEICKKKLK